MTELSKQLRRYGVSYEMYMLRCEAADQIERLERELAEAKKLFAECQLARDTVGFVGSVPECISYLDWRLAKLTAPVTYVEAITCCGCRSKEATIRSLEAFLKGRIEG